MTAKSPQPICTQPFRLQASWSDKWWPCCVRTLQPHQPSEDPWNSEEQKALRKQHFSSDTLPEACKMCENFGTASDLDNTGHGDITPEEYNYETGEMLVNPKTIHYYFGNKCTLACRMCNETNSTGFAKKFPDRITGRPNEGRDLTHDEQMANIKAVDPVEVWILGGEPMLYPNINEVVQEILDSTNARIIVITAGSIDLNKYDFWTKTVLANPSRVRITISCDGTPKINEHVRIGLNLKTFQRNLDLLMDSLDIVWSLHTTVTTENLDGFIRTMRWWFRLHALGHNHFLDIALAVQPHDMSIRNLPRDVRLKYANDVRKFLTKKSLFDSIKHDWIRDHTIMVLSDIAKALETDYVSKTQFGANENVIEVRQL